MFVKQLKQKLFNVILEKKWCQEENAFKNCVLNYFTHQPESFWFPGIYTSIQKCNKCVDVNGEYILKYKTSLI